MKGEFHKARRFTPFADEAPNSPHAALMLRIAIQKGFLSESDYKGVDTSNLEESQIEGSLNAQQIQAILSQIADGLEVDSRRALQATLNNPRVTKWMPGKGNRVAKNKD